MDIRVAISSSRLVDLGTSPEQLASAIKDRICSGLEVDDGILYIDELAVTVDVQDGGQGRNVGQYEGRACAPAPTKRSYQSQQGFSFLGVLALLLCLSAVLGTIQTIWGPVYEETCTPVTAEQEKSAAKINAAIASPFGGDYVPSPSCSKQLVR